MLLYVNKVHRQRQHREQFEVLDIKVELISNKKKFYLSTARTYYKGIYDIHRALGTNTKKNTKSACSKEISLALSVQKLSKTTIKGYFAIELKYLNT